MMDLLPTLSMETWFMLVLLMGLLLLYGVWPFRVLSKLGIPGPTLLPFFGTTLNYLRGFMKFDTECFQKYGKIWRLYDGRQPIIAVLDPAIIKTVLVKECYSTFTNRRPFPAPEILQNAVSMTKDEQWKRIRTVLSPTFTSGKLKEMFPIIKNYGEILIQNVQKKMENDEPIDVKEVFGAYSMDVITSTSFGVDINSMNNPNDPFVKQIKRVTRFRAFDPRIIASFMFPSLMPILSALDLTAFPKAALNFFSNSFIKMKESRLKEGQGSRMDFLQMMIESQKNNKNFENNNKNSTSNGLTHSYKGLTDKEILAQSFIFVFAGYEPGSNSLGYMAYSLATHPDIQKKLQEEIDTLLPNKAPLTYDAIMQLEYLDMVINETQRVYPLGGRIERISKMDVEINGMTIPKGTVVMIPPFVLHRVPEYWPEPEEFRPERFSKENKENIDPYTYLPFGAGPRNCLGMRFALVSMKVAMAIIMQHFSFRVCKETPIPLVMSNQAFLVPEKPIILKLVPR